MPCHTRMREIMQGLLRLLLLEFGILAVMSLEPGYLDFDNLPDTNFSCVGKVIGGYYADLETNCQMFHVCTIGQLDEPMDIRFLCLNGTVFDQETRVCERIDEVDCSKSEQFYSLNLELYGNTQPPILEEEIPVEVKRSSTTTTTTTTTTQRPSRPKSTSPPFYTTSAPPTTTRGETKVITSHHFPVVNSPDIRFNPEEINISLNPDSPPDITRSQIPISFQQQSYSNSEKNTRVTVTTHTTIYKHDKPHRVPLLPTQNSPSQILVEHQNVESPKIVQSTQTPKSVVSYGLTHNKGSQVATPTEINYEFTYQQTEENVEYNTEIPPHPYQYQLNIANLRPPTAQAHPYHSSYTTNKRPHKVNYPTPTTYRSHPAYTSSAKISTSQHYHSQRTEKPPRLQLPLPLLPTLPPLTFSSPAPFSLGRHIETKRYTNDHHSPPRIIISASASVSDNSGRRLNYSLGTIGATELIGPSPATYDDYREEDVGLDPFYHDVPKIKSLRHKREAGHEEDIIKNEQEAADLLKYLFNWYTRREKKKQITIPVASEDITEINKELAPLAQAQPSVSTEEGYTNLFNKLNSDNFTESISEVEKDLKKNLTRELQINTTEIAQTKTNQDIVQEKKVVETVEISSTTEKAVSEIAKEQTHEGNNRRRINKPRTTNRRTKKPKTRRKPQSEQVTVFGNDLKSDEEDSRSRSRSRSRPRSRKIDNIPDQLEVPKPNVRLLADVTIDENNTHTVFIEEYPNFKESGSRTLEIHSKESTSKESSTSHILEAILKDEDKKDKAMIEEESPSKDIVKEEKPPLEVYDLLGEPYPSVQTNLENNTETSNNESHFNDEKTQATVTKDEQSKDDHVKNEDYKHLGNINVTTNDIQNDEKHSTKPYYDDESRKIKTTTSPYSTTTVVETLTPSLIEENTTVDKQNHVIEDQTQELNKTAELLYSLAVVESNHENLDAQPSSYRHDGHYYYDMGEEENIDRDNFDDAKSEIDSHDGIEATTQNIPDENNAITTKLAVKDEKSEIVTETETPEVEAPPTVSSSDYSEKQDDLKHEVAEEKHDKPIEGIEIITLPSEDYQENQDIVEQRKETEDSDKTVESPESQNIDYENKQDVVTTPASEDHTEKINVEKEENEETKLDKLSGNIETQEKLSEDYPRAQEELSVNYPDRQDLPNDNNEEQNEFLEGDKNSESEDQVSDTLATDLQNEEEQHNKKHLNEEKDLNTDSKFENEKEEEVTDTPNNETTTVSDIQNNPENKSVVQNENEEVKTENSIENIEIETTPSAPAVPENPIGIQNESETSSKHSSSHDKLEQQNDKEEPEHHLDKEELHSSKIQSKGHSRNRSRGRNRYKFASRRNLDVSSDGEETSHNPKINSRSRSKSKIEESRHVEYNYVRNRKYIPNLSDNSKNLENTEYVKTYSSKNSKKEEHVVVPDYVDDNYEPLTYHQKPAEVKEFEDFTSKNDLISNKDTDIKDDINSYSTENPVTQEKETPEDNTERIEELTTTTDYPEYLTTNDYTQHTDEQTTILTTQTAEITTSEIPAIETTTEDETQHIHETTTALPTSSEYDQTTNANTESTLDASKNLDATVSYTTEAMTTSETTQATTVPTIVSTTNSPSSIVTLTEPEVQVIVTTPMSEVSTTTKHTRIRIPSSRRRNNNNVKKTEQNNHRFNTRRKGVRGRTRSDVLNNHNSVSSSHSSVNELLIDKHTNNNTAKLNDTESVVSSSTTYTNINNNDYNLEIKHNVDDTTMKQLHSIVLTTVNPRDTIQTTIIPTLPTLMESINSGENRAEIPITDAPLLKSANPTKAKYTKIIFTTTPLSKLVRVELRKDMHGRRYSFNCFDKKIHEFYSDPRDCRLFHYCTSGYSKNQMVDMKFVCDLGTYFDDENLICTKTKPARCL